MTGLATETSGVCDELQGPSGDGQIKLREIDVSWPILERTADHSTQYSSFHTTSEYYSMEDAKCRWCRLEVFLKTICTGSSTRRLSWDIKYGM